MIDRRLLVLGPLAAVTAALIFVGASRDNSPSDAATIDETDDTPTTADPGIEAPYDTAVGLATATVPPVETTPSTTEPVLATVPLAVDDGKTSDERRLVDDFIVTDDELQPKSIVSSGDGLFFAQNMMYRHNVLIYDRAGNKVAHHPGRRRPGGLRSERRSGRPRVARRSGVHPRPQVRLRLELQDVRAGLQLERRR